MRGRDEGGRDDQGTKGLEDQGTRGPKKEKNSQKKKKKIPKINTSPYIKQIYSMYLFMYIYIYIYIFGRNVNREYPVFAIIEK